MTGPSSCSTKPAKTGEGAGFIPRCLTMDESRTGVETTENTLLNGAVRLRQKRDGYRAAIDSVLLAAAVPTVSAGGRVLDLGTGTGAALLCYLHRVPAAYGVGVEIDPQATALARGNAASNGFESRMTVVLSDIRRMASDPAAEGPFDQVFTNPPFLDAVAADGSPNPDKLRSSVESGASLAEWIACGLKRLRQKGGFTIVQRADRLDAILAALHGRAGDVEIIPLWPRTGLAAKRVIVRARKGVRGGASLLPGLVLHGEGQSYTTAADAVLKRGEAFP